MDKRNEAQDLYGHVRLNIDEENILTDEEMKKVRFLIFQFLVNCRPENRFQFPEFSKIIEISASEKDFDPGKASLAFQNLEIYLILILKNPWKTEFHNIKRYCGYFQSKIESHLKQTQEIFKFVGYQDKEYGELKLVRRPTKEVVFAVAFECLVASLECTIINKVWKNARDKGIAISILHVVQHRQAHTGDVDEIVQIIVTQSYQKRDQLTENTVQANHTDSKRIKKENIHAEYSGHPEVPYIDEDALQTDYQEGTLDDHLMASLRLVSKEKVKEPSEESIKKGSEEWSFVRDSLKSKYGEGYYDGQRGDLLKEKVNEYPVIHDDSYYKQERSAKAIDMANDRVKGQPSIRDSGYVGSHPGISQQHVFYPPPQNISPVLTPRAGMDSYSPMKETVPRACVSAQLSNIDQSSYSKSAQAPRKTVLTTPTSFDSKLQNSSVSSVVQSRDQVYPSSRQSYNFSHSAPVVRKDVVSKPGRWTCPHCTSINVSASAICDLCSKSRGKVAFSSLPTSRICQVCTLENQPENSECEACGHQLSSGLQTNV